LAAFVMFAVRFYRERRMDIMLLDDRWRAILYGSLGVSVLAMAARPRLITTGGGLIVWLVAVAGSAYGLYRGWRQHREYGSARRSGCPVPRRARRRVPRPSATTRRPPLAACCRRGSRTACACAGGRTAAWP